MRIFGKNSIILAAFGAGAALLPRAVLAHCPLCTIGAGAAAAGATLLGVTNGAVGIFLGAFGLALGLWMNRIVRKDYIKRQGWLLGAGSFVLTILPLRSFFKDYGSVYISWAGDYGSLLNRTYLIDKFLVGTIVGAVILALAPTISRKITVLRRGKSLPYQGILLSFGLLLAGSVIFQFAV